MLYILITVSKKNQTTNSMMSQLFDQVIIKYLFRLLTNGTPEHKFIILNILGSLIESNPDIVDDGIEILMKEDKTFYDVSCSDLTKCKGLNYLILFAKCIRSNLWDTSLTCIIY